MVPNLASVRIVLFIYDILPASPSGNNHSQVVGTHHVSPHNSYNIALETDNGSFNLAAISPCVPPSNDGISSPSARMKKEGKYGRLKTPEFAGPD